MRDVEQANETSSSLAAALDAPMAVVTVTSGGQRGGCVVGFHTQCSISPVRHAVWLSKANHTYRVALFATHLAVHFLGEGDRSLAELFGGESGDEIDKFDSCNWSPGPFDVPLLVDCTTRLVLERTALWEDGSDHVCVVGQVVDAHVAHGFRPLRMSIIRGVDAGHDAHERAVPDDLTASDAARGGPSHSDGREPGPDGRTKLLEDIAAGAGHPIDLDPGDVDDPALPTDLA